MIPLFAGFDKREEIGYHTFCSSVIENASEPVSICPVGGGQRDGSNAFTYSRFLIPYLQEYRGMAIFADGSDMVMRGDIAELWRMRNPFLAVQVVKHDYKTKHPRKYLGTSMEAANEDYPRKNWSSLMIINCAHFAWRDLNPETLKEMSGKCLHRFGFIPERFIGELPVEWNWLADEYGENAEAKLLHWTAGIPEFESYAHTPHSSEWFAANELVSRSCA